MSFSLSYILDHLAIIVAALGGVLAARGKQLDLFGVVTLALVTAFGGGTLRDMALGALPVLWIADTNFLLTATLTGVIAFFIGRRIEFPHRALLLADAVALALFTVVGADKALAFHAAPAAAVTLGVMTGVAGGIVRDALLGEIPLVFRRNTHFYAVAAFAGASVYVLMHRLNIYATFSTLVSIAVTLALRLVSIRWQLTLPHFELPDQRDDKLTTP